ncbi:unnamed protein product [Amoebophrya sp. A25]|nr:unnamed protein product [Amoebophrya sp. A25]|eukprot:GSA25T00004419001.1
MAKESADVMKVADWDVVVERPFIEKYRPSSLEDVISHQDVIRSVSRMLETKNFPHMIFYGPPGTGKTSTALVLARKLYGKYFGTAVMMLNASDDRGIDTVRGKIQGFCGQGSFIPDPDLQSVPKLVILDEADMLTKPAQLALRRVMEDFSRDARFLILCNYLNKLIPAIQSRCAVFRLSMLNEEEVCCCIRRVCKAEGLEITDDGASAIAELGRGDLRRVLNLLQCASRLTESDDKMQLEGSDPLEEEKKKITEDDVYAFAAEPVRAHVAEIMQALLTMPFREALAKVKAIKGRHHYSTKSLVEVIYKEVLLMELPFLVRVRIVPVLADIEIRLAQGGSDAIQLGALVAAFGFARAQGEKIQKYKERREEEARRFADMTRAEREAFLQQQEELFPGEQMSELGPRTPHENSQLHHLAYLNAHTPSLAEDSQMQYGPDSKGKKGTGKKGAKGASLGVPAGDLSALGSQTPGDFMARLDAVSGASPPPMSHGGGAGPDLAYSQGPIFSAASAVGEGSHAAAGVVPAAGRGSIRESYIRNSIRHSLASEHGLLSVVQEAARKRTGSRAPASSQEGLEPRRSLAELLGKGKVKKSSHDVDNHQQRPSSAMDAPAVPALSSADARALDRRPGTANSQPALQPGTSSSSSNNPGRLKQELPAPAGTSDAPSQFTERGTNQALSVDGDVHAIMTGSLPDHGANMDAEGGAPDELLWEPDFLDRDEMADDPMADLYGGF